MVPTLRFGFVAALLAAAEPPRGRLVVIEVPRHDPDALTLRGVRLLQSADLVLFAAGMPPSILEFARRDARRLQVDGSVSSMPAKAATAMTEGKLVVGLAFPVDSRVGHAAPERRSEAAGLTNP